MGLDRNDNEKIKTKNLKMKNYNNYINGGIQEG